MQDEELVELALAGDDEAFRQLHDRYIGHIFQYAYLQIGDYHRAEEVAQDVMYKMAVNLANFKGKSSFRTWLYTIGRRVVIDYHRKYSREKERVLLDEEQLLRMPAQDSVEKEVLERSLREKMLNCLQQLSVDDRTVIHLRFVEGLSLAETAQVMSRTTLAIKSLQHRAKRKLAKLMKSEVNKEYGAF